jgi:hypothetical protein
MSRLFSLVLLTLLATPLMASDGSSVGKVVAVYPRQQVNDVSYIGQSVPVYTYQPVYDIAIEVGGEVSIVRWSPPTSYYPAAWNVGREISVRPGHHSFVLVRDGAEEVRVPVISQETSEQWNASPHPAPTEDLPPTPGQAPYPR